MKIWFTMQWNDLGRQGRRMEVQERRVGSSEKRLQLLKYTSFNERNTCESRESGLMKKEKYSLVTFSVITSLGAKLCPMYIVLLST